MVALRQTRADSLGALDSSPAMRRKLAPSMLPVAVCDASRRLNEAKIRLAKAKKAAQEQEAAAA